jgi:hypothetical protein
MKSKQREIKNNLVLHLSYFKTINFTLMMPLVTRQKNHSVFIWRAVCAQVGRFALYESEIHGSCWGVTMFDLEIWLQNDARRQFK